MFRFSRWSLLQISWAVCSDFVMFCWILFIFCIINSRLTNGLTYSGPCPDLQPSHSGFVPMAEGILLVAIQKELSNPTYFFHMFGVVEEMAMYRINVNATDNIKMLYTITGMQGTHIKQVINGTFTSNGNELRLESNIFYENQSGSNCHPNVVENVRVWNYQNCTILWCCAKAENGRDHDEALLVINHYPHNENLNYTWPVIIEGAMNAFNKYLDKSPLTNNVIWPMEPLAYEEFPENRFPCTYFSSTKTLLIGLLILCMTIGVFVTLSWI